MKKIIELKPMQQDATIEAEVTEIGQIREFSKFGKVGKVCNAKIKDDSGEIKLTLWNDEINLIKQNSKIRITNGYVKEFNGELQISAGKFGKLETI